MSLAQVERSVVTKTNGHSSAAKVLQDALHLPRPLSFWERHFKTEDLTVAGRQVSGFVVPHWAAGVLLAAILGCMGFMYSRLSDQRDMLIRLDTQLQERDKHEQEFRVQQKNATELQELKIQDLRDKLLVLNTKRGK